MSDDIEKARAAHAALVAAKAACEAAGLTINASEMRYGDALAQCIERGSAHIDARVRQSVPIAFGDEVTVHHRRETMRAKVVSVGRAIIQTTRGAFRLDTGEQNCDPSNRRIGADDLARIKRDLVGKRPPKPAPTLREVTTLTKGDA